MTKTVKRHIAFWAAFAMAMAMLMYFPSGTFNIDFGLKASAEGEESIEINETNFPDENFRNFVQAFDTVDDDTLSGTEIAAVTEIIVSRKKISNLKGIEYFTALETLECGYNSLTTLDVSQNTALKTLGCDGNQLTSLDVSKNTALTYLDCYDNQLTSLDVRKNKALAELYCDNNQLTSLDVSQNTALTALDCDNNQIKSLDVSGCTELIELYCYSNQLTILDVSQNTALEYLDCLSNQLTSLDVSKNTALTYLDCYDNQLTSLDVRKNKALTELYCDNNQLTSLDVSKNTALTYLDCYDNQLTSLDVRKNKALTELYCDNNQLTSLDVRQNTALKTLYCYSNQLTSLDVSKNTALTKLNCSENEYQIKLTGSTFDMSTLPEGFDITKASEWTNAKVQGNILTVTDPTQAVTYKYALGNNSTEIFTLVPVSAELTEDMISEIEAQTYTGSEIKPEMTVSCGGKVLTEGEDYTVSYEDNINKGTAKVIVKAAGDFYTGEATADFEINPLDIENAVITLAEPKLVYNGEAQTQAIESVKINDLILTADDYTISGNTGTNADTYTLTIMGVGNFTGTATADFEISPLDIEDAEIILAETKLVYNGEAQTQKIESVKINDLILTDDDYTISDNNGTNADSYTLTITGVGNFTGTATADFEISPLDIEDAEIILAETKLVYNGEAQTQKIESVKINDLILTDDDYTISDNNGTNADSYTLTITGVGNFTGTATADFEISPLDIEDAEITLRSWCGTRFGR